MPYIELLGRPDRLGANITTFISQIVFAHKNKFRVKFDKNLIYGDEIWLKLNFGSVNQKIINSIFIESIFDYLDEYNTNLTIDNLKVDFFSWDYFEIMSKSVLIIESDLITYFKENLYENIYKFYILRVKSRNYTLPFNPDDTVLIHLRLDDVGHVSDYDGRICAGYFREHINSNQIATINLDNFVKSKHGSNFNSQSQTHFSKIENCLSEIYSDNSNYKNAVIITSPNEELRNIPYPVISNFDESYDLFLLSSAKKIILSKSTFALSSLFFGDFEDCYVPLWGHVPCFGIYTKFDENKNIKFFY
jgi:hypothetical protein